MIALVLAGALLAALALQLLLTLVFARLVQRRLASRPSAVEPAPAAEVVLCLRGADSSLPESLAALARQDYPGQWRLQLVVDSRQDPAWLVAEAQIARLEASPGASWAGVHISPLETGSSQGSRKCAALRQAFGQLDQATQIVALVDADAVVSPGWLTALAAGCCQSGIGAVSGNRWYTLSHGSGPSVVRSIWNGGALVLMTLLQIPWGGSLAIRRALMETSGWRDVLATSLCEDTALTAPLLASGWRYAFRPELLAQASDDAMALAPLRRWISRQLLCARLHHPAWPLVALHGLGTGLLLLLALLALLLTLAQGQIAAAALLLATVAVYELGCVGLLLLIEAVAHRCLQPLGTGAPAPRQRLKAALQLLCWLPRAQWIYGVATLQAAQARRVSWRGITYRVNRHGVERVIDAERQAR